MERSLLEFKELLTIQLNFIKNSCDLYDAGHYYEALRIATSITTILFDTKKQTSILTHLLGKEKRKSILLYSTNVAHKNVAVIESDEIVKQAKNHSFFDLLSYMDKSNQSKPYLGCNDIRRTCPGWMHLDAWLDQQVVCLELQDRTSYPLTRRDLIRVARDKDGGAHVDADIAKNKAYILAKQGVPIFEINGVEITTENLHYASLRQVGFEIISSESLLKLCE